MIKNRLNKISVNVAVTAPMDKVWELWTTSEHIVNWNNVNEDWHTPKVENDLKDGGKFLYRMEAKDGSLGFNHCGTYDKVIAGKLIEYTLTDGRKVSNKFRQKGEQVII